MNIPERGLGRGLGSLLSSLPENNSEETRKLALTQLVPGKHQPRKFFDNAALAELAASIKNQGVIQPLLVRQLPGMPQRYEIVAGERRWRASKLAGLTEVPVIVTEYKLVYRLGSIDDLVNQRFAECILEWTFRFVGNSHTDTAILFIALDVVASEKQIILVVGFNDGRCP